MNEPHEPDSGWRRDGTSSSGDMFVHLYLNPSRPSSSQGPATGTHARRRGLAHCQLYVIRCPLKTG